MSWLKLSGVAEMTGGKLLGQDAEVNAVSIDSRKVETDHLFVAIKGERFDAHDFVADLEGKVAAALVSKQIACRLPQILVEDTRLALAELARNWRVKFRKPVIGLTGSNGKTTLKEMVAAILGQEGKVLATLGNLNNDIGMPLTLLRIRDEHDYAVIEMGANHFGEIDFLTHICKPDIAIINNAGPAHLEGFGDIEGVARAKGEIFAGLQTNGVAVINADDAYAEYWRGLNKNRKTIQFGLGAGADVSGKYDGNGRLVISTAQGKQEVQLNLLGRHNAMNALAATAVVTALDIGLATVKKGLESLQAMPGRLARVDGLNGSTLLDDTYNANPASAKAGIDVLAEAKGKRVLVLGDMGELGPDVEKLHAGIGQKAKASGIDSMFCLGKFSAIACAEFGRPEQAYEKLGPLLDTLKGHITNDMTILVKGSRSARMERVVDALRVEQEAD